MQSSDKNLMVPVGGAIVASHSEELIAAVAQTYPGEFGVCGHCRHCHSKKCVNVVPWYNHAVAYILHPSIRMME